MNSEENDTSNKLHAKKETTRAFASVALMTLAMLASTTFIFLSTDTTMLPIQEVFAANNSDNADNAATHAEKTVALDGVSLSFDPKVDAASGLTIIKMKITDEKTGFPLTHVDWVIKVISPKGKEVFKSSTIHSHLGNNQFGYKFFEPGKNTVSVQVASLGPKMLGTDVPTPAHTRIFKSGDPMAGWKTDPSYFFGARTAEFIIDVDNSEGSNNTPIPLTDHGNNSKLQQHRGTKNLDGIRILDGSERGTKVKLELSTIPEKIVPGKPVTLVLNVKRADNGTLVTHPDALVTISGASSKLLESGPPGNPVIPINGAFHGHSGEKVITTVFPSIGRYSIDMDVNSIPVSNYKFGHVKTSFEVNVSNDEEFRKTDTEPSQVTNVSTTTAIPITNESNHVAIIGQDAPYYSPARITINSGTTLTFRNHDAVIHTVTGTDDGNTVVSPSSNNSFDTAILVTGQEKQITFDKTGTYNYFCAVHPFMRGIVSVVS